MLWGKVVEASCWCFQPRPSPFPSPFPSGSCAPWRRGDTTVTTPACLLLSWFDLHLSTSYGLSPTSHLLNMEQQEENHSLVTDEDREGLPLG